MKFTSILLFIAITQVLSFIKLSPDASSHSVTADGIDQTKLTEKTTNLNEVSQSTAPKVQIKAPNANEPVSWGSQVRYTIEVTDEVDGSSRYGEITANECLLAIEYFSTNNTIDETQIIATAESSPEPRGLSVMKTSTCFGCHADKMKLAAPSFSEIAQRYGSQAGSNKLLGKHIIEGSSGVWGTSEMPSHPDITMEAAEEIATYILEQGAKKYCWIYPGLEGAFRIIDKPTNDSKGFYRLTASYTSKAKRRGQHSMILKVQ